MPDSHYVTSDRFINSTTHYEMNTFKGFEKWLKRSVFRFPKCRIRFYEVGNRGVEAKEVIRKGEVVITVPDRWVLYPENSALFQNLSKHDFTNSSGMRSFQSGLR